MNIPLNIDWQQILLHLFNFSILAGGLYLLLYRPVKDFMRKREEYYQSMDEQARQDRASAQALQQEYQARLAACRECVQLVNATCQLCGCYVEIRAAKRSARCPASPRRWG